jgi:hypothetical protein
MQCPPCAVCMNIDKGCSRHDKDQTKKHIRTCKYSKFIQTQNKRMNRSRYGTDTNTNANSCIVLGFEEEYATRQRQEQ